MQGKSPINRFRILAIVLSITLFSAGIAVTLGIFLPIAGFVPAEQGLFRLGQRMFSVYGFSAFLIPLFFLYGAVLLFIPGWTRESKAVFLGVPLYFVTAIIGERLIAIFSPSLSIPVVRHFVTVSILICTVLLVCFEIFLMLMLSEKLIGRRFLNRDSTEDVLSESDESETLFDTASTDTDSAANFVAAKAKTAGVDSMSVSQTASDLPVAAEPASDTPVRGAAVPPDASPINDPPASEKAAVYEVAPTPAEPKCSGSVDKSYAVSVDSGKTGGNGPAMPLGSVVGTVSFTAAHTKAKASGAEVRSGYHSEAVTDEHSDLSAETEALPHTYSDPSAEAESAPRLDVMPVSPLSAYQADSAEDDPIAPLPLSTPLSAVIGESAASGADSYTAYIQAHGGADTPTVQTRGLAAESGNTESGAVSSADTMMCSPVPTAANPSSDSADSAVSKSSSTEVQYPAPASSAAGLQEATPVAATMPDSIGATAPASAAIVTAAPASALTQSPETAPLPVFDPADPDNLFTSLEEITEPIERIKRGEIPQPAALKQEAVSSAAVQPQSVVANVPGVSAPISEAAKCDHAAAVEPTSEITIPVAEAVAPQAVEASAASGIAVPIATAPIDDTPLDVSEADTEDDFLPDEPVDENWELEMPLVFTNGIPLPNERSDLLDTLVVSDTPQKSECALQTVPPEQLAQTYPREASSQGSQPVQHTVDRVRSSQSAPEPSPHTEEIQSKHADPVSQEQFIPAETTETEPGEAARSEYIEPELQDTAVGFSTNAADATAAAEAVSAEESYPTAGEVMSAAVDQTAAEGTALSGGDIRTNENREQAESFDRDTDPGDMEPEVCADEEDDSLADDDESAADEAFLESIAQPAPIIPAKPVVPPPPPRKKYAIPFDLLTNYPDGEYWIVDDATRRSALMLKSTFNEFKIDVSITGIRKGPVVTMFEMLPSPGIKLSKITNLQDNIALRLAASSVRIVAPIPGKHAVGIEVPNKKRSIVSFRELIEADLPEAAKMAIPIVIGKDVTGNPQLLDLAQTPHLLIAGATGSGKSVCVNTIILSILYNRRPDEVKLILVDPKIVELKLYNDIAHLLTPVITEPKRAFQALQYALCEMERRYSLLDNMGVRDIKTFNAKIKSERIATEPLPYIVIIIDEFADLMATSGKELEATVARLCAMSRAVGIHLVLATQRPSIDVITGLIKANIPSRIAFMVASKTDSRIILDEMGAEKLLGKGDMLFVSAAQPFPTRMQGAFVSEQEVERVVACVKEYCEPEYIDDEIFVDDDDDSFDNAVFSDDNDPLYDQALEIVTFAGKASASYVQRKLKIGYNRAARLIEEMEARGIVGPANGSKPREVIRHR